MDSRTAARIENARRDPFLVPKAEALMRALGITDKEFDTLDGATFETFSKSLTALLARKDRQKARAARN